MASTQLPLTMTLNSSRATTSDENSKRAHAQTTTHATFFDKTPEGATSRAIYLKIFFGGTSLTIALIFTVFVIFWNALAKSPAHNLPGWIVVRQLPTSASKLLTMIISLLIQDFDGGFIGQEVTQGLTSQSSSLEITWTVVSAAQFPSGIEDLRHAVMQEHAWVAVAS